MIAKYFKEVGRLTFTQLDKDMYLKLTNSAQRFHSPSKMNIKDKCTFPYGGSGALQATRSNTNAASSRLGIQYAERMSQRHD